MPTHPYYLFLFPYVLFYIKEYYLHSFAYSQAVMYSFRMEIKINILRFIREHETPCLSWIEGDCVVIVGEGRRDECRTLSEARLVLGY